MGAVCRRRLAAAVCEQLGNPPRQAAPRVVLRPPPRCCSRYSSAARWRRELQHRGIGRSSAPGHRGHTSHSLAPLLPIKDLSVTTFQVLRFSASSAFLFLFSFSWLCVELYGDLLKLLVSRIAGRLVFRPSCLLGPVHPSKQTGT